MDLLDLMRTTNTCRYYKPDPIAPDLLAKVLDAARWAPTGGNRQPLRFIVVSDREKKLALKSLYLPIWNNYVLGIRQGSVKVGGKSGLLESADYFAQHMEEIPVLLLVCARLDDVHPTDNHLGRLSIVGGASVYPAVQNIIMAAREAGLGTALTTLHCAVEPEIKPMFNIPADISLAAVLMMGWPAREFPKKLTRRPLDEMVFDGEYGVPLAAAKAVP
jgi:nitroreductase